MAANRGLCPCGLLPPKMGMISSAHNEKRNGRGEIAWPCGRKRLPSLSVLVFTTLLPVAMATVGATPASADAIGDFRRGKSPVFKPQGLPQNSRKERKNVSHTR